MTSQGWKGRGSAWGVTGGSGTNRLNVETDSEYLIQLGKLFQSFGA